MRSSWAPRHPPGVIDPRSRTAPSRRRGGNPMRSTGSGRGRLGAVMVSVALLGAAACAAAPTSAPSTTAEPSSGPAGPTTVKLGDGAGAGAPSGGSATPTFTGAVDIGLPFTPQVNGFSF